jgi:hypothetical protein
MIQKRLTLVSGFFTMQGFREPEPLVAHHATIPLKTLPTGLLGQTLLKKVIVILRACSMLPTKPG